MNVYYVRKCVQNKANHAETEMPDAELGGEQG